MLQREIKRNERPEPHIIDGTKMEIGMPSDSQTAEMEKFRECGDSQLRNRGSAQRMTQHIPPPGILGTTGRQGSIERNRIGIGRTPEHSNAGCGMSGFGGEKKGMEMAQAPRSATALDHMTSLPSSRISNASQACEDSRHKPNKSCASIANKSSSFGLI
jgi:hypothetical protein